MAIKTTPDLNACVDGMSPQELKTLIAYAETKLEEKKGSARLELIAEMRQKAEQLDLSFEDLFHNTLALKRQTRKGSTAPIKFRHPNNSEDVWSGRGKQPRWLKALLDAGHSRDEFLVEKAP